MKYWKLLLPFEKIPILVIAILVLLLISFQTYNAIKRKKVSRILNDTILFLGFLSLTWGIFLQIYDMLLFYQVASKAHEVNPLMMRQGLKVTLVPIFIGLAILVVSAVAWFMLRASRFANYARDAR